MEPFTVPNVIDHDESLVHNWRVSQLKRLGIPGPLAETYADRIDWHQIVFGRRGARRRTSISSRPSASISASTP